MEHVGPVEQVLYVERPVLRHSGVGIASFVISLCAGFALFAAFVFAGVMAAAAEGGGVDEESPAVMVRPVPEGAEEGVRHHRGDPFRAGGSGDSRSLCDRVDQQLGNRRG
jgi:hypothetical protein